MGVIAIKSHVPDVIVVNREAFIGTLGGGLATMASLVMAPRPYEQELFPFNFDITVNGVETQGWIHNVTYTNTEYVEVELQYQLEGEEAETTVKVGVSLNFHGDVLRRQEFETTWDSWERGEVDA